MQIIDQNGRHELKHYINYIDFLQLRSRLPYLMNMDENSTLGNGYRVKSLYFDNYYDKALMEKIDGVNEREKFRLRLYNGSVDFIRLEKKSKKNGLCYKQSAIVSYDECRRLIEGDIEILKRNGNLLLLELYTKMNYEQLRPKNIVDYNREAFVFSAGNVRVTLDYDIRKSFNVSDFLKKDYSNTPVRNGRNADNVYILEVKYDNFLPEIIRGIVSLSSRQQTAFSKYAVTRVGV